MSLENIVIASAIIGGVVALVELLEYIFTRNIPWLARLVRTLWRRSRRAWRRWTGTSTPGAAEGHVVVNFSHPLTPAQVEAIRQRKGWPAVKVLEHQLSAVPEGSDFLAIVQRHVDQIDLLPQEWQQLPLLVVPPGYAPVWSMVLADLHGRMGYFPDVVRLRPAPPGAEEQFEVAEILSLREIRSQGRGKR